MTVVLISIALVILLAVAALLFLGPKYTRSEWIETQGCQECGEALSRHSLQLADVQWKKIEKEQWELGTYEGWVPHLVRTVHAVCEHCGAWFKIEEKADESEYAFELRRATKSDLP